MSEDSGAALDLELPGTDEADTPALLVMVLVGKVGRDSLMSSTPRMSLVLEHFLF